MASTVCAMLSLVMMVVSVRATTHIVGDDSGWSPTTDLLGWASTKKIAVGDELVFNFASQHAVQVVTENDYANCNTGSPLSSYSGGQTAITLDKAGPTYFICPTPGHCVGGMKLSVVAFSRPDYGTRNTPSIPTIPVISDPNPTPSAGFFPPPIDSNYYGPPSLTGGSGMTFSDSGWGQLENLKGCMVLWFPLVVATFVGVIHG